MKKIIVAITMLIISTCTMLGMSITDSDAEKKRIDTDIRIVMGGVLGRTLNSFELDAYLMPTTGDVEVNLLGIGHSEVYILDSDGRTIDYSSVNTDIPTTVYLSTGAPGSYSVVIMSDTCYAEGHFTTAM